MERRREEMDKRRKRVREVEDVEWEYLSPGVQVGRLHNYTHLIVALRQQIL
jgi:hypothetical protein